MYIAPEMWQADVITVRMYGGMHLQARPQTWNMMLRTRQALAANDVYSVCRHKRACCECFDGRANFYTVCKVSGRKIQCWSAKRPLNSRRARHIKHRANQGPKRSLHLLISILHFSPYSAPWPVAPPYKQCLQSKSVYYWQPYWHFTEENFHTTITWCCRAPCAKLRALVWFLCPHSTNGCCYCPWSLRWVQTVL